MKKSLSDYKLKLEKEIKDYMDRVPPSERSVNAVKGMLECWEELDEVEKKINNSYSFDEQSAKMWVANMKNEDGTDGEHWTIDETNGVAQAMGVYFGNDLSEYCWWVTMNMLYSDYYNVAKKYNLVSADFFGNMAKAFLFDKDAGSAREKLSRYYSCVVNKELN